MKKKRQKYSDRDAETPKIINNISNRMIRINQGVIKSDHTVVVVAEILLFLFC